MKDLTIYSRINEIDKCFINHAAIQTAIKGIEEAIQFSSGAREPTNVLLTGEAGTGKTTACNAILTSRPKSVVRREGVECVNVPAFYSLVPSPVTIRGVASAMLSALGDPAPNKGTALDLTYRLGILLQQCRTEVILLDELQHLLKQDMGKSDNVKDWLKTIINEYKVPVIVVGMPECAEIISKDEQLARRFPRHYRLSDLPFGPSGKGPFRKFVATLSNAYLEYVELEAMPGFLAKEHALKVFAATGGNPANTTSLFKHAAQVALVDGRESVSIEDFSNAYSKLALPNALNFTDNPFEMDELMLTKALKSSARAKRK